MIYYVYAGYFLKEVKQHQCINRREKKKQCLIGSGDRKCKGGNKIKNNLSEKHDSSHSVKRTLG